jgi:hypothetical protein
MYFYIITIYLTTGGKKTGHRYSNIDNIDDARFAIVEKLRKEPGFDIVAYVLVTKTEKPATKPL